MRIETTTQVSENPAACAHKQKYPDQKSAEYGAKKLKQRSETRFVVYYCSPCACWHCGSATKEMPKGKFRGGRLSLLKHEKRDAAQYARMQQKYEKFISEHPEYANQAVAAAP